MEKRLGFAEFKDWFFIAAFGFSVTLLVRSMDKLEITVRQLSEQLGSTGREIAGMRAESQALRNEFEGEKERADKVEDRVRVLEQKAYRTR